MKDLVWTTMLLVALTLAACGGGSGGAPGGGDPPHPLEGTWLGMLVESREFSLRIDRAGVVSDVSYYNPAPLIVLTGGVVLGGSDVYTLRMDVAGGGTSDWVMMPDAGGRHATFASMGSSPTVAIAMFGVLERGATSRPTFFAPDIWGDWTGYGYAYSAPALDFATLAPVTASASDGSPLYPFEVTLPGGSSQGVLDGAAAAFGAWAGTVPATGGRLAALMTSDKQFVAVMAFPVGATALEDFSYYALDRD